MHSDLLRKRGNQADTAAAIFFASLNPTNRLSASSCNRYFNDLKLVRRVTGLISCIFKQAALVQ